MEIADNARKHRVADEDIEHAVRVVDDDGQLVAIHAMALRQKFYDYLQR